MASENKKNSKTDSKLEKSTKIARKTVDALGTAAAIGGGIVAALGALSSLNNKNKK